MAAPNSVSVDSGEDQGGDYLRKIVSLTPDLQCSRMLGMAGLRKLRTSTELLNAQQDVWNVYKTCLGTYL